MPETEPRPGIIGLRIHDLIGLVVGYGLAAMLVRSFWPGHEPKRIGEGIALAFLYLWLGLAMGGPFVLLLDRRGPAPPSAIPRSHPPSRYSGEESAWIVIGGYLTILAVFIVPSRHRGTLSSMLLGPQAVVAVFLLGWLRIGHRKPTAAMPAGPRWTRRAAVVLLVTWPVVWVILIVVLK